MSLRTRRFRTRSCEGGGMGRTCVFFHAHPDDEALFTSGTMARLAAEGHRVVLVVATAGDQGLAAPESITAGTPDGGSVGTESSSVAAPRLGDVRLAELRASAAALGVARVEHLGYADSGLDGLAEPTWAPPFVRADADEAAGRLAAVLAEEHADLVTTYDPAGGYGHPDHVRVHQVGARAAELAGTPTVLEATVDRELLLRALRLVGRVYRFPPEFDVSAFERAFAPRAEITHRIDVRRYARAKRASLAAHATQATGGDSVRTVAALRRLPGPLFRLVLGTEWYVRRDLAPGTRLTHPLADLPTFRIPGGAR
ncbi:N-acetylglucosaminyl deacetylase, LmbE family [Actinopolymorpha cephalotaxi]|uniref:LmbE family N-acetylglucosaminyl deacetylase n=1 Tax=Actinopolymorpha cephalotaxi TaxID=504797 RepID=A0A1I2R188_9ACTN|nr:PIG-L family deacetylase [Actinopolymorpha cephalotaxi]NYH82402.1 LmbE family N-acetylglucosaminyl deacetylase [Actinopolymorpha cephalotaxi]SFG34070.1 N-acetylglucosaminyl deacetylase, LmbE family [Actinopolymorpha cephalotaxi]